MSRWEKLIKDILKKDKNLRFEDLTKALTRIGYKQDQPKGGSSHYTFRKPNCMPITIPKQAPMNKAYIELVSEAVQMFFEEDSE